VSRSGLGVLALLVAHLATGCAGLPTLHPASAARAKEIERRCSALFPRGPFTVVHAVSASLPMGMETSLVAVSAVGEAPPGLRSVLMSPEGVVLFEGRSAGDAIQVERALPPLHEGEFARRLFADVRLLLTPPEGELAMGMLDDGTDLCRYRRMSGTLDVRPEEAAGPHLLDYGEDARVRRTVRMLPPFEQGFAKKMVLDVSGLAGYQMRFELIEHH
jgi:hypothetical protein